jgi:hypothetical protein
MNEKTLGANHPSVAVGLKNLIGLYQFVHRDSEAAALERRLASVEAVIAANQAQLKAAVVGP